MAGVATVLMWLLTTGLILAVPFGVWWLVDRSRRQTPAPAPAPFPPSRAPLVAVTPAAPRGAPAPPVDAPTAPVPVPRRARTLTVAPDPRPRTASPDEPADRPADTDEILAPEREVVVTREEDHQDVLAGHHAPGRPPTSVTVELCSSTVTRGRYRGDYAVEVRLDGARVGELTAAMSARYRHLVDLAGPVRCRGVIDHGARGFQVDLRLPDVV
ncbi:hypothetical protein [Actinomycetospora chibensis]|uniref:Uncharacterized protein n=1 Tax=Actinomycetospora chibensis TaxID=663606 RepID=A0ABV9RL55_9PSEU|nr:hypothetical protein [Actinomycetospora chibensis]MDD7923805.1 hypothetical protein [Actinomycetospora chibensis]